MKKDFKVYDSIKKNSKFGLTRMVYKVVNFLLAVITKRIVFMGLIVVTFTFSFYCLKGLLQFMHVFSSMNETEIDQMSETLNGIAGVLVAIGVLLEERETIQKMANIEITEIDTHLNEVAHHNGLGLLLLGLFMEIITLLIEAPKSIINTGGLEIYLFGFCFLLVVLSMLIEIDFIKDYTKSFFKHKKKA